MREQRLAGAGLADDGDEPDLVVEEQVEGEGLLLVARPDAPDALLRRLDELHERLLRRAVLAHRGVLRVRPVAQHHEGVRRRRLACRGAASGTLPFA